MGVPSSSFALKLTRLHCSSYRIPDRWIVCLTLPMRLTEESSRIHILNRKRYEFSWPCHLRHRIEIDQSIKRLFQRRIFQSRDRSITRIINQSIKQAINQSTNPSIGRSVNQSINQSVRQFIRLLAERLMRPSLTTRQEFVCLVVCCT